VAPRETPLRLLSPPFQPLEPMTTWSRFSTRLPLTLGSLPRVSPPLLQQTFPPSPLGNKCSSRYLASRFKQASKSQLLLRTSQLRSTTCPLRLLTWTSPRNPQTSPLSRHPSATLPPVFYQPLRPLFPHNTPMCHNRPHTPPTSNIKPARQEKGKERAPPAPPLPPPNTGWPSPLADSDLPRYDMSTSPPILYGNSEAFSKTYPHT